MRRKEKREGEVEEEEEMLGDERKGRGRNMTKKVSRIEEEERQKKVGVTGRKGRRRRR